MRPIDGVRLIDDDVLERARRPVTPPGEKDLCLLIPTSYGMGYLTGDYYTTFAGSGSFGHTGAGGSVAFAQPERELSFAYVMNLMSAGLAGYDRADNLIAAAVEAADRT
jgi:CubicO group peptidase (beta-lactamase class C family)